jgi:hypothetical protein
MTLITYDATTNINSPSYFAGNNAKQASETVFQAPELIKEIFNHLLLQDYAKFCLVNKVWGSCVLDHAINKTKALVEKSFYDAAKHIEEFKESQLLKILKETCKARIPLEDKTFGHISELTKFLKDSENPLQEIVSSYFARQGFLNQAFNMFRDTLKNKFNTRDHIFKHLCKNKRFDKAIALLNQIDIYRGSFGTKEVNLFYFTVIKSLCENNDINDIDRIDQLINKLSDKEIKDRSLRELIETLCINKRFDEASCKVWNISDIKKCDYAFNLVKFYKERQSTPTKVGGL